MKTKREIFWHFYGGKSHTGENVKVGDVVLNNCWMEHRNIKKVLFLVEDFLAGEINKNQFDDKYRIYKTCKMGDSAYISEIYTIKEAKRLLKIKQL